MESKIILKKKIIHQRMEVMPLFSPYINETFCKLKTLIWMEYFADSPEKLHAFVLNLELFDTTI